MLYDQETGSLWTQMDGRVLRGEMKGTQLASVPAVQTTWAEWRKLYPDTLVLSKHPRINNTTYGNYHANPERLGIAGSENPDVRLPGKSLVVALREGKQALAVSLDALKRSPVYQTKLGGRSLVIVYDARTNTVRVYDRKVAGRTLNFEVISSENDILLRDRETSTLWSGLAGKAVEGPLVPQQFAPVQHLVSYWFAWAAYYPKTRLEP